MKIFIFIFFLFLTSCATNTGLVQQKCRNSPSDVIAKLSATLTSKGIGVVKRFDHQKNAASVGLKMDESILLIFGNPKMGTHFFTSKQTSAIDLPMKALAYKNKKGDTVLVYNDPQYIAKRHGITDRNKIVTKMSGALKSFSQLSCE